MGDVISGRVGDGGTIALITPEHSLLLLRILYGHTSAAQQAALCWWYTLGRRSAVVDLHTEEELLTHQW